MPKKFKGENTKAVVARARKADQLAQEKAEKLKVKEDEYWEDDDKHVNRKLERKETKDLKRQEELQRKLERKLLEDKEILELTPITPSQKVTAFALQKQKERISEVKEIEEKTHLDAPLEENLNTMITEEISASGINAAVALLSVSDAGKSVDRHPEKRMAAAFKTFEADRLPQLKKENSSMRLTQLKQILRKEWQKHPQNPIVQKQMAS